MNILQLLKREAKRSNFYLAAVGACLILMTMLITTVDVVGRFFRNPLPGAFEMCEVALAAMIFLGWAYTQAEKGHISIDLFVRRMPQRTQDVLDVIIPFLGFSIVGFIAWQAIPFALDAMACRASTEVLDIPLWPFKFMILIGGLALCCQLLLDMVEAYQRNKRNSWR